MTLREMAVRAWTAVACLGIVAIFAVVAGVAWVIDAWPSFDAEEEEL